MNLQRIVWLLAHPIRTAGLIRADIHFKLHPDEPWLEPRAVAYCAKHLDSTGTGIEWGSGRSTQWFAKRLHRLISIEYNQQWYQRVREQLAQEKVGNVDLRFIPVSDETPEKSDYVCAINSVPDHSLSLIVVDGHFRQACVAASLQKVRPGGLLLIDNTDRLPTDEWGVPSNWPMVHQSRNERTQTSIWQKPG